MDPSFETLATQFSTVKAATSLSHVMEYGQTSFKAEVVGDFEGILDIPAADKLFNKFLEHA